jgi:hypothetical protein
MDKGNFKRLFDDTCKKLDELLFKKQKEYATEEDVLHNFKNAGTMQGISQVAALSGMMAKHTISIYDMIRSRENGKNFGLDKWDEKILDHINYLIILRAMLYENVQEYRRRPDLCETDAWDESLADNG